MPLAVAAAIAVVVRLALLPTDGFRYDLDTLALWAGRVASGPISSAYDGDLNLPPVITYVWAAVGALHPPLAGAVDASDLGVRMALKAPAVLADIALMALVAWHFRDRPNWAVGGALAIGLNPALVYDSAWWGQVDALYILPAFVAFLFAQSGRPIPAAVALAFSVMTKPQAIPLVIVFAAYAVGRLRPSEVARAAATFALTIALLWVPFLAADGPSNLFRNIVQLQTVALADVTVSAWNAWWLAALAVPGALQSDASAVVGPVTPRLIGYVVTAIVLGYVAIAVARFPTPRRLALGLAAATLVSFSLLTSMHERYALGAIVFLAPLLPDRRVLGVWVMLSIAITANLFVMVPPWWAEAPEWQLWQASVIGAAILLACTLATLWLLHEGERPKVSDALAATVHGP